MTQNHLFSPIPSSVPSYLEIKNHMGLTATACKAVGRPSQVTRTEVGEENSGRHPRTAHACPRCSYALWGEEESGGKTRIGRKKPAWFLVDRIQSASPVKRDARSQPGCLVG